VSGSDLGLSFEHRTVKCTVCGGEFDSKVMSFDGRIFGRSSPCCSECTEQARINAQQAAEAAAAASAVKAAALAAAKEAQEREQASQRALDDLDVPRLYVTASLETFTSFGSPAHRACQESVLRIVRRYLQEWPDSPEILLFSGGPGTGKGHMLWTIARHLASAHAISAKVVKLADLVRELRSSWGDRDADSEEVVLARYRRLSWLAIDEVSRHAFYGRHVRQHLYDVVDHRLEHRRSTILTTNEPEDIVAEILGPPLLDRLQGSGGMLEFGSESWRCLPQGST
jgi:DNA replication protein DnaC